MAETITIARPYARAAFEQAQTTADGLAQWSDFLRIAALVATDETMRQTLASPQLTSAEKSDLFLNICSEVSGGDLPAGADNFIKLLAENARLSTLPYIVDLFERLRQEAEKTIQAELVSAFPVTDAQREQIAESLRTRLQRTVALECQVDPALLGGVIIRAGDLVIDGSVRGQLNKLAVALRH